MRTPEYKLHQLVHLDPTHSQKGDIGRIIGIIDYATHYEYIVSVRGSYWDKLTRHYVHVEEICPVMKGEDIIPDVLVEEFAEQANKTPSN